MKALSLLQIIIKNKHYNQFNNNNHFKNKKHPKIYKKWILFKVQLIRPNIKLKKLKNSKIKHNKKI